MRVLVTAAAILLSQSFADADSLGGAARKEAQRRGQPRAAAAKQFGDSDLAARSNVPAADVAPTPEPMPTPATGSSVGAPVAPEADAVRRELEREERERRQQEARWRQAASAARARVANAQQAYDYVCAGGVLLTGG